jgi:hypothetical protein
MRRSRLNCLAAVLTLAGAGIVPAAAAPLDGPACEQLQTRLDILRSEGAAADMARGPEWARANLPPDRLQRIGTLLDTEEQLNFRCGKARINLPTTIEGGEEEIPAPGEVSAEGAPKSIVLPQKAPAPPQRPAAAAAVTGVPKAAPKAPALKVPAPKPPAAKAPAAKEPTTKPAVARQPDNKKATQPQKTAQPPKAAKPMAEGSAEPQKAPPAKKKQPAKADDAYRPPQQRRPPTTEDSGAALVPRQ